MGDTALEKTAEELRHEIDELRRQQREITERLRDPRGIRRGGLSGAGPRNQPRRGFLRPAERNDVEDEPPAKRRLSSAVVKETQVEGEDVSKVDDGNETHVSAGENGNSDLRDRKLDGHRRGSWSQRDAEHRGVKKGFEAMELPEPAPRNLPKNEDPKLVNRNRRMLGNLLGTLERFRKEDKQLSGTDAYARRSAALQKAEQKAREESERLRLQERETLTEKRRRDLTLRARVAAKAEQKELELLFLRWCEQKKKLGNFIRTKAEPHIYYAPTRPLEEDTTEAEQRKEQAFLEWKAAKRQDVSKYQKEIEEKYLSNVEKELEKWENARKARKANNGDMNLQETMDKELETHIMEHGPKKRKIPGGGGGGDEDEEDEVEDINGGEDEMTMDDVLEEGDGNDKEVATDTAEAEAVEGDIEQ
ncbi:pinin [Brassica napus]|uniref:pinin n=1 Tax=Brassica napus TaxID=3708 RepID=UPI0020789A3C|nr:pinin [Brassica napus]